MKPYYEQAGVTIYHGDCREIVSDDSWLDNVKLPVADAVLVTDPPYGIEGGSGGDSRDFGKGKYVGGWSDSPKYIQDEVVPVISRLLRFSVVRGAVTPGIRCLRFYPEPADMGCFWTPAAATHGPWGFTCMQPILYYGRDYRAGKGAFPSSRQVTERAEKNGHPCPKPESAWTWLLTKVTQPNELVIDPFTGSGTTLVAAKRLGRKAIGIEIEERYCEIAAGRLAQGALDMWSA